MKMFKNKSVMTALIKDILITLNLIEKKKVLSYQLSWFRSN